MLARGRLPSILSPRCLTRHFSTKPRTSSLAIPSKQISRTAKELLGVLEKSKPKQSPSFAAKLWTSTEPSTAVDTFNDGSTATRFLNQALRRSLAPPNEFLKPAGLSPRKPTTP